MKNEFADITEKAKTIIAKLNCDFAEVRLSMSTGTVISLSGDEIDSLSSGDSIGGSVRVLSNGTWGFVSFNDIQDIENFIRKGVEISSSMNFHDRSHVARAVPLTGNYETGKGIDFVTISIDEKFELIKGYNDILRSSEQVQTTRALYRDSRSFYAYVNSEGSDLGFDKSYCGISLTAIAREGSVIQPFHDSMAGYGGFETVQNKEAMAEKVVKTAVDLLKAESVPGGTYRVVVDPKLSGVFIHEAFGHLSEADFVYENEKMRNIMTLGRIFGPSELNVYDDGTLEKLSGYIPFDDEGVQSGKTPLIEKGVLCGRLHSRETAARMKEPVTGNGRAIGVMRQPIVRMTNTYIENGPFTRDELFGSLDNGIYAVDVIGGQTNLEMFTFTSGFGYRVKKGRIGKMYKDIVLSGNVFHTLKNIEKIANDREMFGGLGGCGKGGQSPLPVSFGGPHMLIKDVLIGGKQ